MDDCFIHRRSLFSENVDYMSPNNISNFDLHLCWKENNSVSVKSSQDDISSKIPSSVSRRLENVSWRRMYKQIWNLSEALPATINWSKSLDITWLFGPKYGVDSPLADVPLTSSNLSKLTRDDILECAADEVSSMSSTHLMSFDDRSLMELLEDIGEEYDECCSGLKLVLKLECRRFVRQEKNTKKRVKFNYIINSREIMNGISFDYHFLDPLCL
ncbi:hypothetical protein METBIDRAFT_77519 [Metschnikowia bicuspidata var. bicuspidata NRRL YB-4993]|uniref:Nitrogen regulatory protein areA GATA-like domain-containing protein n=1 Tax=Metschnikowia bicuspidata var. bicuspidata NRRL YB-4993 TaxID=869754 RepID=A0A1A0HD42_9ASCO|nr:hypothetical protein METBIDRAFT_77519 [Metschnikowia bicuspidata var. bicuspidata NRRL YB-4993]OBA21999.1 hypothetical protein METBIDRAFT_77519 [Metschnikowia bicuspidata var. bicuspidata NRRL YB-4993]